MQEIKIITWNIDELTLRRDDCSKLSEESGADFLCLQEIRTSIDIAERLRPKGYLAYASESEITALQGTAIFYRKEPINKSRTDNPIMQSEGRTQCLEYENFYILNVYLPDSGDGSKANPNSKEKLNKKTEAFEWLISVAEKLNKRKPTIICGDFNVGCYYSKEVGRIARNSKAGFRREEKELFSKLLNLGYTDVIPHHFPCDAELIVYLNQKVGEADVICKFRKDYILVSERIKEQIVSVDILTGYLRRERSGHVSSHLPIELVIRL
jgi:exodeoxyribonuclease III